MKHPRELLNESLKLVHADLAHISKMVVREKLTHDCAADLARYVKVLLDAAYDTDRDEENQRKKLSKIPTEELIQKAREILSETGTQSSST